MQLEVSSKLVFTPKFNGNKSQPECDRITITYKNPTAAMKSRLLPKPDYNFNYDAQGKVKGGQIAVSFDRKAVIDGMLIGIENLEWKDESGIHVVKNSKDLFDAPVDFDALIDEVADKFREELERKLDEKN